MCVAWVSYVDVLYVVYVCVAWVTYVDVLYVGHMCVRGVLHMLVYNMYDMWCVCDKNVTYADV